MDGLTRVRGAFLRSAASALGVAAVTAGGRWLIPGNPTTVGFGYLLLVLVVASTWGFVEAFVASIAATVCFNFFFFAPVGTLTIADPQNWVALFSFLATAIIASRLSAKAEQRARDSAERQQDLERLYTFSRAILLIGAGEPFPKQLAQKLVDTFEFSAVLLYERRTGELYRAGPQDFDGMEDQLREAAMQGVSFADPERHRVITAVRLGSEPIASLAVQGVRMPDSVLQGIANLVAIGLERARAQDLAHEVEAARRSEQLRTTLIDAMAHEFKTPLTSIKAATTSLLAADGESPESRKELLTIADEEAEHLTELIDAAVEMARLDTAHIEVNLELSRPEELVAEAIAPWRNEFEKRRIDVTMEGSVREIMADRRLVRLAIKQLVDNALKYSPPGTPVSIRLREAEGKLAIEVTDRGKGIPEAEQRRIFERFYRSPAVSQLVPGSGLGLTITNSIARAHHGELALTSRPGETTFRLLLPAEEKGERVERRPSSGSG